jgi:hypothetical protein
MTLSQLILVFLTAFSLVAQPQAASKSSSKSEMKAAA